MELLLDHGAGVNTLSVDCMTALDGAVEMGFGLVADLLRQWGGHRAREALEIENRGYPDCQGW